MQKHCRKDDTILHIIILALCIFPIILSLFLFTDSKTTEFRLGGTAFRAGIPCMLNTLTGFRCPACGMTRAFIYMSSFNISAAWKMNRAGVLLYIFCLLQLPYRFMRIIKPTLRLYESLVRFEAAYLIITGIIAVYDFVLQFF